MGTSPLQLGTESILTKKHGLEVDVGSIGGDGRFMGITYQEERDGDVLLRDGEPPEGFHDTQLVWQELKANLVMTNMGVRY